MGKQNYPPIFAILIEKFLFSFIFVLIKFLLYKLTFSDSPIHLHPFNPFFFHISHSLFFPSIQSIPFWFLIYQKHSFWNSYFFFPMAKISFIHPALACYAIFLTIWSYICLIRRSKLMWTWLHYGMIFNHFQVWFMLLYNIIDMEIHYITLLHWLSWLAYETLYHGYVYILIQCNVDFSIFGNTLTSRIWLPLVMIKLHSIYCLVSNPTCNFLVSLLYSITAFYVEIVFSPSHI